MEKKTTKKGLYATHTSDKTPLVIGNVEIPAYVLNNGMRVFSQNGVQKALGYFGTAGNWLPNFVNTKQIKPHISSGLSEMLSNRVKFERIGAGGSATDTYGYDATILIDICDAIIEAKNSGDLSESYMVYAKQAELIMRAVAKVGIIALVDEATGYQYDREKDELQKILKAYISEELLAWEKRFPDEFYREIFRLNNWGFTVSQINARPGVIGTWTKKFIYSVLPKGVLSALLNKTPKNAKGKLATQLHRSLTREQGIEHLNKQIIVTVALMSIADNWKQFEKIWNKKFGQQVLFNEDMLEPKKAQQEKLSDFNTKLNTALNYNPKNKE